VFNLETGEVKEDKKVEAIKEEEEGDGEDEEGETT
jgi:hypothetical protein